MKFGGTSVANVERIRNVARHVKREVDAGHQVAVVVSAMSGKTNELVAWCKETSPLYDQREYDAVVASGEQVTAGLLAIALQEMGLPARSWLGWQAPVLTNDTHGSARIESIDGAGIIDGFKRGEVAVVAGFQGLHKETGRITTLGRGGSDTSAVALAAAVKADRCDIYTDVDGVYSTDPRVVPKVRRMERIAFEEMLEMASLGAAALRAVRDVMDSFTTRDSQKAENVWQTDRELDDLVARVMRAVVSNMSADMVEKRRNPDEIECSTHLLFITKNLERVGDHATNIAEVIEFQLSGGWKTHARPKGGDSFPAAVAG